MNKRQKNKHLKAMESEDLNSLIISTNNKLAIKEWKRRFGDTKNVSFEPCEPCEGTTYIEDFYKCPACKATGYKFADEVLQLSVIMQKFEDERMEEMYSRYWWW